jgi:putative nucleotidyltransferase with HDIG domain
MYKPAGVTLDEMRIEQGLHPQKLYIRQSDKIAGIREVQKVFNQQLRDDIRTNNFQKVRDTVVDIVRETLTEPRSGSLEGVAQTVHILVTEYTQEAEIIRQLMDVSSTDYSTVLHSINVMALALGYAAYVDLNLHQKKILGLCALLHDVGKTRVDANILKAPRKLTDEEFREMQRHTLTGYNILSGCRFGDNEIKLTALQHHEKLDGSGYPSGTRRICETAQIIGLIDCYEALTNDDRPYRDAMEPLRCLQLLKNDVEVGKFNRRVFEKFAYSLI